MRANPTPGATLDDVLTEIAAEDNAADAATLRAWLDAYPQFRSEIIDFVTDLAEMQAGPPPPPASPDNLAVVVNRTMSQIQRVLDGDLQAGRIADLADDLRRAGQTVESLEQALGLDRSIMAALIGGWVKAPTIPARVVDGLASGLRRGRRAVMDALWIGPTTQPAYKAKHAPSQQQADFHVFVEDSELSPDAKARWLAEPPDPGWQDRDHG